MQERLPIELYVAAISFRTKYIKIYEILQHYKDERDVVLQCSCVITTDVVIKAQQHIESYQIAALLILSLLMRVYSVSLSSLCSKTLAHAQKEYFFYIYISAHL